MNTKTLFTRSLLLLLVSTTLALQGAEPLRVFIRAGPKSHGPNQHDHPHFLADWVPLLKERGMESAGGMTFPTAEQWEKTDVLIVHADDGMKAVGPQRENFEKFLKRGGGVIVIHAGILANEQHEWAKSIQGGAWIWSRFATNKVQTKYFEGNVTLNFVDTQHPITRGAANIKWRDEIYWEIDMSPDVHVLATSARGANPQSPQMWTYEKTLEGGSVPYRVLVSIPGHDYDSFNNPKYRALLMRGISWAGKRANVEEFVKAEEAKALTEPAQDSAAAPAAPAAVPVAKKVLIVGGGNAHDFNRWFNQEDVKILSADGKFAPKYTDKPAEILPALKDLDVLFLSNNQPLDGAELRKGIFDFLDSGKGLILAHAATWISWRDWPEFNRVLVTGGSRGHDRLGEFEVTVTAPSHPVMAGVPATFKITDELYNFIPDEKSGEREVLATSKSPLTGKEFPAVWITKHDKARIVCITLGHDGKAHELPAFVTLLKNTVNWVSQTAAKTAAAR